MHATIQSRMIFLYILLFALIFMIYMVNSNKNSSNLGMIMDILLIDNKLHALILFIIFFFIVRILYDCINVFWRIYVASAFMVFYVFTHDVE